MIHSNKQNSKLAILSLTVTSLLLSLVISNDIYANHVVSARHVNAIQTKQARSIAAGVKMGRLTPKEARKLRKEQNEIINMERDMREDGMLNAAELEDLFKKLQYSQKHINKLLRNNISTHAQNRKVQDLNHH